MTGLEFRQRIEWEGKVTAARILYPACETEEQADVAIQTYVQRLLAKRMLPQAGIVVWGENMFTVRPGCVRAVWGAIEAHPKVLVLGGGSVSKSFTGMAWNLLNWAADPEYTTTKLISTTGGHARSQTFSTLKMLHEKAIVPLPGFVRSESIEFTEGDKRAAIAIVRIREGEDNSGVLQGFHPLPRSTPHPFYGRSSRVVAALDEAEEIPLGVWTGVENMLTPLDTSLRHSNIKVMGFYNPKDISSRTAALAEPVGGWGEFDVEAGVRGKDTWLSRHGWFVVRIDPAKTENVKQRKVVFPGFQTYEYYREAQQRDGGNSQHYYVFARGAYPPDSAVNTVCPQRVVAQMRGDFVFSGRTIKVGAADIAVDGRDDAVFSAGRFGKARAFRRLVYDPQGQRGALLITFKKERDCLQLDQQFLMRKGSTEIVATECKTHCIRLGIDPGWFMVDRTGNGGSIHDLLCAPSFWSPLVRGVDFGKKATETKVLEEDKDLACDQFDGIHSEVLFAITRWGEFGFLGISAGANTEELERQLIGRRYKLGPGKTLRVEDKDDYKKRISRSPDHAESLSIMLHAVRTGGQIERAAMTERRPPPQGYVDEDVDSVEWLTGGAEV